MDPGSFPQLGHGVREVSAADLKASLHGGEELSILDTRRPADFETWHISHPNARPVNVPFTEFLDGNDPAAEVPDGVPDGPMLTCCAKGISSHYVAEFLARESYDIAVLRDGMRGWARLYEATDVETATFQPDPEGIDTEVSLIQYHRPSSGCLAYLVVSGPEALVVDPLRTFADRYADDAIERGAEVRYVMDTHVHADHVSGVRNVSDLTGAERLLPAGAEDRGLAFDATLVDAGDEIDVGATTIEVVPLPGHTTEMTGLRVGDVLLTGDSLFTDSVARPDLEAADAAREAAGTLWETLQGVAEYPDGTVVAPGHAGPETQSASDGSFTATVGTLRESLDAFDMDREAFVGFATGDLPPQPKDYERVIAVNLGRATADAAEAFELELGPNNCAAG
ncbi:MAG: MBL fold metallo-hydrolase [Haloarculaceae archaeon]